MWEVKYTDEFGEWWDTLSVGEQQAISRGVGRIIDKGIALGYPHSSKVVGSRHSHMRELRVQYKGDPYRIMYAFDPRRSVILLIGGNKRGVERWYDIFIAVADSLYDVYLQELKDEGII